MIFLLRPLKKIMLAQLQRVREIELSKTGDISVADDFKGSLQELCRRGFVSTKMVIRDGKEMVSVYLTEAGKLLLNNYEQSQAKSHRAYNIF
jgi:hypothetical protein